MNLLQGAFEDYQVNYEALAPLCDYLSDRKLFEKEVIERAESAAQILFKRDDGVIGASSDLWRLLKLLSESVSNEKKELKKKLTDLFLTSLVFESELEKVKLALVGSREVSKDLEKEKIVVKLAFHHLSLLSEKLRKTTSIIQKIIPVAISIEGEEGRLAEAIIGFAKECQPTVQRTQSAPVAIVPRGLSTSSNRVLSFFSTGSKPLSESLFFSMSPLPGSSPGEDLKKAQLDKLTMISQKLFQTYSSTLFKDVSPSEKEVLLKKIEDHLPFVIQKLFISEPHNLKTYEKQAILFFLREFRAFVCDLTHTQTKGSSPTENNEGIGKNIKLQIMGKGIDPEKLPSYICSLLEEIVSHKWGLSGQEFQSITSETEKVALDCMVGTLFVVIDKILKPENALLFLERLTADQIDLDSLEQSFPPIKQFDASDKQFSYSVGEEIEHILRKAVCFIWGDGKVTDALFKLYKRNKVGEHVQKSINAVFSSEVSMKPLLLVSHFFLNQEGSELKGVFIDKKPTADLNLRKALKEKIEPMVKRNSVLTNWLLKGKIDDALTRLVDLVVSFAETKEGLYLALSYVLEGYLKWIKQGAV